MATAPKLNSHLFETGCFVGRAYRPDQGGPSIVLVRGGGVYDITSRAFPTMSALLEHPNCANFVKNTHGEFLGSVEDISAASASEAENEVHLLSPFDLQAIKACGVTFAQSMIERVIEERAAGDADKAHEVRQAIQESIGAELTDVVAGSAEAERAKQALIDAGMWSQYLEVGIGPDAEVFTKGQPMSSVGWGARVGLHPSSKWNNPEPEIVLAVDSFGDVKGVTLGNDVNLRDIEGRSALLLGKAKDNNASCAIGPFIRLFDETYSMDDVRQAELRLTVTGADGFELDGRSDMRKISRDPLDLVKQTLGAHHQYPDGFCLFLGTLFAPTQDRGAAGQGFTHHLGDVVTISSSKLGDLVNVVDLSPNCLEWSFGTMALMKNLSQRGLL